MKMRILTVFVFCVFVTVFSVAQETRNAMKVDKVIEPYTPDEFSIYEDEEEQGDHLVSNAPECDIRSVMVCYDRERIRFDIILYSPITFNYKLWYGVVLEYKNNEKEYYAYFTDTKELHYIVEINDEIVKDTVLTSEDGDFAAITSSYDVENTLVAIVINKDKHIAGVKGKKYYLTSYFVSGFVDENDNIQKADDTITVNINFVK